MNCKLLITLALICLASSATLFDIEEKKQLDVVLDNNNSSYTANEAGADFIMFELDDLKLEKDG